MCRVLDRRRDDPVGSHGFGRVLVLPMTAPGCFQIPAILLQQSNDIANLHDIPSYDGCYSPPRIIRWLRAPIQLLAENSSHLPSSPSGARWERTSADTPALRNPPWDGSGGCRRVARSRGRP